MIPRILTRNTLKALIISGCGLVIVPALGGCKWINPSKSDNSLQASRPKGDPILGMRLPPQNVLGPDDGKYARDRGDPILTTPASRDRSKDTDHAGPSDKPKGDISGLPPRSGMDSGVPYRPSLANTPAALTNSHRPSDELTIDRKPATLGRDLGFQKPSGFGESFDEIARELKKLGATWQRPVKDFDGYTISVDMPQGKAANGPIRRYMGAGTTASLAMKAAQDQILADMKR
jgi:hypothetical protein